MTVMTDIFVPAAPEHPSPAGQTAADPVRITISVEGGLAPAVLAQLRRSLPADCRITLQEARPDLTGTTARQRQILQLLAQDLSNKDIGRRLGLSHFTVRNHVSQLLRLLGVSSRKAAIEAMARLAGDHAALLGADPGAPRSGRGPSGSFAWHA